MAGRLISIWVVVIAVVALILLAGWRLVSGAPLPFICGSCRGGHRTDRCNLRGGKPAPGSSPGARDNGTGLLAVLSAAEERPDGTLGIILTGAEEFGLLGARHLARAEPVLFRGTEVLNLDTLADRAASTSVTHNTQGGAARETDSRPGSRPWSPCHPAPAADGDSGETALPWPASRQGPSRSPALDWEVLRLMHTHGIRARAWIPGLRRQ